MTELPPSLHDALNAGDLIAVKSALDAGYEENVEALRPRTLGKRFGPFLRGGGSTPSAEEP